MSNATAHRFPSAVVETTMLAQFESGLVRNGSLTYNVQMARDAAGCWHQRHVWHRDPYRGEMSPPVVDPWIVSGTGRLGPGAHMKQVTA